MPIIPIKNDNIYSLDNEYQIMNRIDNLQFFNKIELFDSFYIFDYSDDCNLNKEFRKEIISRNIFYFSLNNNNYEEQINKRYDRITIKHYDIESIEKISIPKEKRIDLFFVNSNNFNIYSFDKNLFSQNSNQLNFKNVNNINSDFIFIIFLNKPENFENFKTKIFEIRKQINTQYFAITYFWFDEIDIEQNLTNFLSQNISIIISHNIFNSKISLSKIISSSINYNELKRYQNKELVDFPIIIPLVIFKENLPLGITFTTKELLEEGIDKKICIFYSRDRRKKWIKGESSGYYHNIKRVSLSCDRTFILLNITGDRFCHINFDSCFHIYDIINNEKSIIKFIDSSEKSDFLKNIQLLIDNKEEDMNLISDILINLMKYIVSNNIIYDDILRYNENNIRNIVPKGNNEIYNNNLIGLLKSIECDNIKNKIESLLKKEIKLLKLSSSYDLWKLIIDGKIQYSIVDDIFLEEYYIPNYIQKIELNDFPHQNFNIYSNLDNILTFLKDNQLNNKFIIMTNCLFILKNWIKKNNFPKEKIIINKIEGNCIDYLNINLCNIAICNDQEIPKNLFLIEKNIYINKYYLLIKK